MANENLSNDIAKFLQSQTNNPQVAELGREIQNKIELGSTAIHYKHKIEDSLISDDAKSGYIVQKDGLAGFRRFYNQEQRIRAEFLNSDSTTYDRNKVKSAIETIMGYLNLNQVESIDLQWQACLSSLQQSRFILTGGPGTGKTTTVVRMMLLYLILNKDKHIALSAPTGKAANQMMHSISQQIVDIEVPNGLKQKLELKAQTIHRLLGYNNQKNTVKYNQHNPLPYDLIIIDESSMLDVSLTYAILQALKPSAQLILIGDKNQLPAVEAGNVFADLCQLLTQVSENEMPQNLLEYYLNDKNEDLEITHYMALQKNYRFTHDSTIAQLCTALSQSDSSIFHRLKNNNRLPWFDPVKKTDKKQLLKKWFANVPKGESTILLSAVNNGFNSVAELNDIVRDILYSNNSYNQGMPIMVTKNDYALGVFNGDIGHLNLIENQWQVVFNIQGDQKFISLSALSDWQQANAITIHKSQGSEYDHVLIALPNDDELKILTNALLYTAISRAKKTITLWADEEIIDKIIKTSENRITFLK